ncbi:PiggyBac transposable element-derived protein 3 [Trichinella murrelli]|uniref:PiggyBac transposable element-derived protein 3 n=1 Tax=Trichinella murrelli TaxID=144512 RepID=A0A0V0UFQ0_9BILA|nr:PiggyBac transposable element-derived protein 3 [Trichinella murrelli]
MISVLERPEKHELYFNNFFASYDLLEKLSDKMIRATGTIRNSRTRKILIMPVDEVKKKYRGFFDHVCNGTVYVCRWNDNAVVTLASNHLTHHPIGLVQRCSQLQKKHVKISMPEIVRRYNTSMGVYRPRLRSKKWWWKLFSNALNLAVVAAWQLHRELHKDSSTALSHLDFRRDVTTHLLRAKPQLTIQTRRRTHPPETLRITQGHYLEPICQGRCCVCN